MGRRSVVEELSGNGRIFKDGESAPIVEDVAYEIGEPIELELEGGRRWECFIQSSDGNLLNRGGIK
jgi:hypothetical protein